jgi:plasmid stability protein
VPTPGDPVQIRLRHYSFTISEPYAAGHSLSPAEAQALNSLRAENIRNNVAKLVTDAVAVLPDGALLPPDIVAQLQDRIAAYDTGYEFVLKHTSGLKPGSIEAEARNIARDHLLIEARRAGTDLSDSELAAQITELLKAEWVQLAAREKVARRQAISTSALEELL